MQKLVHQVQLPQRNRRRFHGRLIDLAHCLKTIGKQKQLVLIRFQWMHFVLPLAALAIEKCTEEDCEHAAVLIVAAPKESTTLTSVSNN